MTALPWIGPLLADRRGRRRRPRAAIVATGDGVLRGSGSRRCRTARHDETRRIVRDDPSGRRGSRPVHRIALPWPGIVLAPLLCVVGVALPAILQRRTAPAAARGDGCADPAAARPAGGGVVRRAVGVSSRSDGRWPRSEARSRTSSAVRWTRSISGARWRDELAAAAERLELPELRRTVAALSRTETLGASLADSTAELAASVRAARRAAVTERARTAPVKMLFPLVFLVLPAFLLLTVVPVLLTTVQSIR